MLYQPLYNPYKSKENNSKSNNKKIPKINNKVLSQNGKLAESLEKNSPNLKPNIMRSNNKSQSLKFNFNLLTQILSFLSLNYFLVLSSSLLVCCGSFKCNFFYYNRIFGNIAKAYSNNPRPLIPFFN